MGRGERTRLELFSQPNCWASTIESVKMQAQELSDFLCVGKYHSAVFTGCGSTYYLALAAAEVFQHLLKLPARGLPASEIWLSPSSTCSDVRTLLIAVGRSGMTTETVRACQTWRAAQGDLLTLSCYPGTPVTALGKLNLLFPSAQEKSVVQTRAFTSLYLAATAIVMLWAGRDDLLSELLRLPAICRGLLDQSADRVRAVAGDMNLDRFYFLGSGPRYGLACELSLKMKEMSLTHCEPFHFMEFRHGPKSMVTPSTCIVALVSESNRSHETPVLDEMRALGARVFTMGENEIDVSFHSGLGEWARNVLYLPIGQLLAFERALFCGLDPDQPRHLKAVVELNAAQGAT